ncbi:MAG TPA: cellulose synthase subunit BcsC-related outer membrane protein [Acidobacteriaceae bacterium]|nr:cellulose synthase subunit BcsC-related outer membrane protein [Acidobacteriaceae bacterium]
MKINQETRRAAWRPRLTAGLILAMLGAISLPALGQSGAEKALLDKAAALEQSGHIDLAAQSWQQVLLSDPNNQEALAGLARWARLSGNDAEAANYLDRLRAVNPNSPEIAKIQALVSNKTQNQLLQQAAELARAGHNEEALRIYRQTFGTHPPDNWALAYYDTEAGIPSLRQDAIDGLRGLTVKYPSDSQYGIDLGRVLTYDPRTRAEGERMLEQYPQDATAQAQLRQAVEWDVQNPAAIPFIREYLKEHPDEDLSKELADTEATQARATAGLARTPAEQAAFRALAKNHLEEAQQRFMVLHQREPKNARVLGGLGFLRMRQSDFAGAVNYFQQAEQNGLKVRLIQQSLETSRFWNAMQQGTRAMNDNRLDEALRDFKTALALRPTSQDAQTGLAGLYMKRQEPDEALPYYQALVKKQPRSSATWRGLFMAQALSGEGKAAIATTRQFPPALRTSAAKDPDYLRTLATAYVSAGNDAEARRILLEALALKYPVSQELMRSQITLQYAALLAQDKEYQQAAAVYRKMIDIDPNNVNAWQGMVSLEHLAGRDADAITVVERMPPDAYDNALRDPGFLSMLAAIYQIENHPDVAQEFLQRAVKIYEDNGQALPIPLQLQVAAVELERNHAPGAYSIYRSILTQHPDRLDAWKGLLAALHATGHDADAMAQLQQIPPRVRQALAPDVEWEQTLAAIYAANGDERAALGLLTHVEQYYRDERRTPPSDVDIANAWTLFNTGDDRDLYRQLMTLGDRGDMSDDERRQVQTIWASWAQRRAAQAAAAGHTRRAVEILTAAAQAFPGNPAVSKALAVGFQQAGQPKDAMAIYQSLDMTNATAADYQSMVGVAIAVQNMKQAEAWLREGLQKFPKDPKTLAAGAQFEQARGDNARAADYWRASLNAMPPVSPATSLAHTMDQADMVRQTRPARPTDLVDLLNPDAESAQGEAGVALPSYSNPSPLRASSEPYGPDPYYRGTAPVQLNQQPGQAPSLGPLPGGPPANGGNAAGANPGVNPGASETNPGAVNSEAAPGRTIAPEPMQPATLAPPLTSAPATVPPLSPAPIYQPPPSQTQENPAPQNENQPSHAPEDQTLENPAPQYQVPQNGVPPPPPANPPAAAPPKKAKKKAGPVTPYIPPSAENGNAPGAAQAPTTTASAGEQPEELGLDTSPALTTLPNADDQAMQQAQAALDAARQPVDPSLAPTQYSPQEQQIPPPQNQQQQPPYFERPPAVSQPGQQGQNGTNSGASDDDLMRQDLPPLRGPYERPAIVRQQDLRQQAQQQLSNIMGGYSSWLGGTGFVNHRSGTAGYDALTALEAPFEASAALGTGARLTFVANPVFLDSGAPSTSPLLPDGVVERLGTAPINAPLSQQNATGIGGEVQLAFPNFAASAGYTPYGFLVSNVTARLNWKPDNGPFTLLFNRDSVKDSQLAYAGLQDPGSAGPNYGGNVWGGVMATGGEVQFGHGDANSGYYISGGGQYLDGVHVQNNTRFDGDAGAYWLVKDIPDEAHLTAGVNFFGMHYTHNSVYFTYGQGGYFSPQAYFLANVPISLEGRYGYNIHYSVVGAFGVQAFQEDSVPFFPLDSALQTANNNPYYSAQTVVSGNYDLRSEISYHLSDHWFAGGFVSLNNTRDYNNQVVGFFVRLAIRPQVESEAGPSGLYPWDGLRPYRAP